MLATAFLFCQILFLVSFEAKLHERRFILGSHWESYKRHHKLAFPIEEESMRRDIFMKNLKFIRDHNKNNSDLVLGMNQFGHLTNEEFKKIYLKKIMRNTKVEKQPMIVRANNDVSDIDWRQKNVVTRVKNQEDCGSCWAFSTTGSLEGQYAKLHKKTVELSEQDLVDCSTDYGNRGCDGGLMTYAYDYVKSEGINSEKDYPYSGKDGTCKHDKEKSMLKLKFYVQLPERNEEALSRAVYDVGPISVAMDASGDEFRFYKKGVYKSTSCSSGSLNHGVLAVGLGSKPSPHYIVKNSWGEGWGIDGYFLIARNEENMCGIASMSSYPVLAYD